MFNATPHQLIAATMLALLCTSSSHAQMSPRPARDRVIWVQPQSSIKPALVVGPVTGDLSHQRCDYRVCPVVIKVTVDPMNNDPTGRTCSFEVPYVLVLRHPQAEVTWTLVEVSSSRAAKFRDSPGAGDGIEIHRGPVGAMHFRNRSHQNQSFGWHRNHSTGNDARVYLYDMNVEHNFGAGRCDVPDPIIVNRN